MPGQLGVHAWHEVAVLPEVNPVDADFAQVTGGFEFVIRPVPDT